MKTIRRGIARIAALFTRNKDEDRLREEFEQHLAMAAEDLERAGLSPQDARRQARLAFGGVESMKETYRDRRGFPWLESLLSDAAFGLRQLSKHRTATAVAVFSLALGTGACVSAFRLMDALLWRPLPVANPQELWALSRSASADGKLSSFDGWTYPAYLRLVEAAGKDAELIAISYPDDLDITYASDAEIEKARIQYVSGNMFPSFGLRPEAGRLFTAADDRSPGNHPYAVLSHDYWMRRFGGAAGTVGRTFRFGDRIYEITGVGPDGFTGADTGTPVDIFVPTMMHTSALRSDSTWHRTLVRVKTGVPVEPLRQKFHAVSHAFEVERTRSFPRTTPIIQRLLSQVVLMEPAASGISSLQSTYRRSLGILGVLVVLVLLIACVNVANLMSVQAAARAREMALRVSIGASRGRLVQMVLVESALLACFAAVIGGLFAWWSAPFVVSQLNPPDNPVRLALPFDWRLLGFGALLTVVVTVLFGVSPALSASGVRPSAALKGGEDPGRRRRVMHFLIAGQVAFCFLVLFVSGLFVATLQTLSQKPLGFSPDNVFALETVSRQRQPNVYWEQVAGHLRLQPGVESVSMAGRPWMNGWSWNGFVAVGGGPPNPALAYFLDVAPDFMATLQIQLIEGRDFRSTDRQPGSAIVNETFVKTYFGMGDRVLGRTVTAGDRAFEVVGVVRDAPYRNLREPQIPVAFFPFSAVKPDGTLAPRGSGSFLVRMKAGSPPSAVAALRAEVGRVRSEFRVSNLRSEKEIILSHTVRERLLARLAMFFSIVAVFLAAIGLYGVLDYSVLQRRREIGIRLAIGARGGGIARLVTMEAFAAVLAGAFAGLGLGIASGRYVETLLYGVRSTDVPMLLLPSLVILAAALLAAWIPVARAVRIDPIQMLRSN